MPDQDTAAVAKCILLLATNLSPGGGAEEQTIELAIRLKSRNWNVQVASMLTPNSCPARLHNAGIPFCSLQMPRGIPDPRGIVRLARLLRRSRPQILHSHMTHANLLARAVRLLGRVPVLVCTLHGLRMYAVKSDSTWMRESAHRLTDSLADVTTAVCKAAADYYVRVRAVPDQKLRVMPNGVDTLRFHREPEVRERVRQSLGLGRAFVWLAVGRIERPKDYGTMLRAFAQVRSQCPSDTLLLICGRGSLENEIRALARDLGTQDHIRFLGARFDIPELMNGADAYLMSSAFEALPMALLEASSSSLPIVSTEVGGTSDIVVDGISGFLTPAGDAELLARAMVRLMNLPEPERSQMGAAARQRAESKFRLEKVVDGWETLYDELLARKGLWQHAQS